MTLSLQEVLIVGSCSEQVKFSELTLDMFRMLQTLEREPQEDLVQMYDASPAPGRVPFVSRPFTFDYNFCEKNPLFSAFCLKFSLFSMLFFPNEN